LLITVHPDLLAPAVLSPVNLVLAVGHDPGDTLRRFTTVLSQPPPSSVPVTLETGETLAWFRDRAEEAPFRVRVEPPRTERRRHSRKYTEGLLVPERSFYFRGPDGKLNLRAHNLWLFLELASGVDDDTWLHHLRRGDYSQWFREVIGDDRLADETETIERQTDLSAAASRKRIREAVERNYTAPANAVIFDKGSATGS
jgi:hypothetical protein